MNDNPTPANTPGKRITKLQLAVAAAIDSYDRVTCSDVAERATAQLGYEPSPTHVSRVLTDWGWSKTTIKGKVGFVRPPEIGEAGTVTVGTPGDVLRNTHWTDRFTCPECLTDHTVEGVFQDSNPKYITCQCGARLRLEVEDIPEAVCTVADPDEEDSNDRQH